MENQIKELRECVKVIELAIEKLEQINNLSPEEINGTDLYIYKRECHSLLSRLREIL